MTDSKLSTPSTPNWYGDGCFGADPDRPSDAIPILPPSASPRQQSFSDEDEYDGFDRNVSQGEADTDYANDWQETIPGIKSEAPASHNAIWREIEDMKSQISALSFKLMIGTNLNRVMLLYYSSRYTEAQPIADSALYLAIKHEISGTDGTAALWKAILHDKLDQAKQVTAPLSLALVRCPDLSSADTARLRKMLKKYGDEVDFHYDEQLETTQSKRETNDESQVDAKGFTEVEGVDQSATSRRKNSWVRKIMINLEAGLKGKLVPPTPSSFAATVKENIPRNQSPIHQRLALPPASSSPSVFTQPPPPPSGNILRSSDFVLHLMNENAALKQTLLQYESYHPDNEDPAPSQHSDSMYERLYADVKKPMPQLCESTNDQASDTSNTPSEQGRVSLLINQMIHGESKGSQRSLPLSQNAEHALSVSSEEAVPQVSSSPNIISAISPRNKYRNLSLPSSEDAKMTDTPGGAQLDSLFERRNSTERRKSLRQVDTNLPEISHTSLASLAESEGGRQPSTDFLSSPIDPSPLRETSTVEEEREDGTKSS